MSQKDSATTGPDNPLHAFTPSETKDLETAQRESDASYAQFKEARVAYIAAQGEGKSEEELKKRKDRRDELEEAARAKENVLKGLQDFCD